MNKIVNPNQKNTLVILYTCSKNIKNAKTCKNTWLRRVKNFCIVSDQRGVPNTLFVNSFGYENLTDKTLKMWKLIYKKYGKTFKYFIKIDDDTLYFPKVFYKNLAKNKKSVDFLGDNSFWSKKNNKKEWWPAGSFYLLSIRSLKKLVRSKKKDLKTAMGFGAEDYAVAFLLRKQKIYLYPYPFHLVSFPFRKIYQMSPQISSVSSLTPFKMHFLYFYNNIRNLLTKTISE